MQRLLGVARTWTKFRAVLDVGKKCPGLLVKRSYADDSRGSKTRFTPVLESRWRTSDRVLDKDFVLIYRCGMDNYIHLTYGSCVLVIISSVLTFYNTITADNPAIFPTHADDKYIGARNFRQLFIMYGVLFVMVCSLIMITKRFVLRMYYNGDTRMFRAVRIGFLPGIVQTYDFKAGALKRVRKISVFPWVNMQYKCNNETLLILDDGFKTNADYERLFDDSA